MITILVKAGGTRNMEKLSDLSDSELKRVLDTLRYVESEIMLELRIRQLLEGKR